jgi:hypothetical protein
MQSDYEGAAEQATKQHAKTISIENTTINRNNAMNCIPDFGKFVLACS